MKLYIARHGETFENENGIIQGQIDSHLNAKGMAQAKELGSVVRTMNPDLVFASDLDRALTTGQIALEEAKLDLPIHTDKRLRERNFGQLQGTHRDGVDWEQFWGVGDNEEYRGIESSAAFMARLKSFLNDLKQEYPDAERVLLFAHGGTINHLGRVILGDKWVQKRHHNGEMVELEI